MADAGGANTAMAPEQLDLGGLPPQLTINLKVAIATLGSCLPKKPAEVATYQDKYKKIF
jgi:hypothetical protein